MLNHQHVCHNCDKGLSSHQSLWHHTQKYADKPTLKDLVREVSSNNIEEQDVPRKQLWDDCAGLNAADKTKVQRFNPYLIKLSLKEQGRSQKTKFSQKKAKLLAEMDVLPKPPPDVTEVFPDEVLSSSTPEIVAALFQEKEQPDKPTPRTKGDIIGVILKTLNPTMNPLMLRIYCQK